jgi:hypothetical protein
MDTILKMQNIRKGPSEILHVNYFLYVRVIGIILRNIYFENNVFFLQVY